MDTSGSETKRSELTFPFSKKQPKKTVTRIFWIPVQPGFDDVPDVGLVPANQGLRVWRIQPMTAGSGQCFNGVFLSFQHFPGLDVALFQAAPKPFY